MRSVTYVRSRRCEQFWITLALLSRLNVVWVEPICENVWCGTDIAGVIVVVGKEC